MITLEPLFVDFTWGAGAATSDLSMTLANADKKEFGWVSSQHVTGTNMESAKINTAIK